MVQIDKGVNLQQKMDIVYAGICTVTKAANSSQGVNTFSHNLGYKPAILAYVVTSSIYYPLPWNYLGTSGTSAGLVKIKYDIVADIDTINCYIICPNISGDNAEYVAARTQSFYIYFLKQDASQS